MLLCNTAVYADWLPESQPIPEGASTFVNYDVYTTYNDANNTVFAVWAESDGEFGNIFYAIYDGSTWTTPGTAVPLGSSFGAYHNVIASYNAANQTVVITWSDYIDYIPYYAVFDGTTWITPGTPIPMGTSTVVYNDVYNTYDAAAQTIVAAWVNDGNQFPYYSVFDGLTWVTTDLIPVGVSTGGKNDVVLTYDAARQTVVAAWGDRLSNQPIYAVFNGTSWTTPGTAIPQGTSSGVNYNVSLVFQGSNNTIIAAWGDSNDYSIYYNVFNGTTWGSARTIPLGASVGVYQGVSLTYNSDTGQVFAAWSDSTDYLPFYSILNGTVWTTGAPIPVSPSLGIDYDVILVFDPYVHQVVATWGNYPGDADPFYNIFVTALPSNLTGSGCCNSFATQRVWVNRLEWTPVLSAIGYNIYRNGALIAQVGAGVTQYNDAGNRVGDDVYVVTAIFADALESIGATVTIPAHRACR